MKEGIIRLNDKKRQCFDSEQLVVPSVDRHCFGAFVYVHVCAHLIETDCPLIVHF